MADYRTYFPDWPNYTFPYPCRPSELSKKDCRKFTCVGTKPNPDGPGTIYQFQNKPVVDFSVPLYAAEPGYPDGVVMNEDGYWTWPGGFRGLHKGKDSFLEIPCIQAIQHALNRVYTVAAVKNIIGDLEFATLKSKHDFVISEEDGFFHDMMGHVAVVVCAPQCCSRTQARMCIVLDYYSTWKKDINDPTTLSLLEFCFGLASDLNFYCNFETLKKELTRHTAGQEIMMERYDVTACEIEAVLMKHAQPFFQDLGNPGYLPKRIILS